LLEEKEESNILECKDGRFEVHGIRGTMLLGKSTVNGSVKLLRESDALSSGQFWKKWKSFGRIMTWEEDGVEYDPVKGK